MAYRFTLARNVFTAGTREVFASALQVTGTTMPPAPDVMLRLHSDFPLVSFTELSVNCDINVAGLEMKPKKRLTTPPIIQHGDFRFLFLICSKLTNISHREALRGNVDTLFVLEWNRDTETFNALVESAALDIHAYIIQCNDR